MKFITSILCETVRLFDNSVDNEDYQCGGGVAVVKQLKQFGDIDIRVLWVKTMLIYFIETDQQML